MFRPFFEDCHIRQYTDFARRSSGARVEKGQQETGHRSDCPAAKHIRELQVFLRFVERNFASVKTSQFHLCPEVGTAIEIDDGAT